MKIKNVMRVRLGVRALMSILILSTLFCFGMVVLCAGSFDYMDETGTYDKQQSTILSKEAAIYSACLLFCAGAAYGCYNVDQEIAKIIRGRIRRVNRHAPKMQEPQPRFIIYSRRKRLCRR